MPFRRNKYNLGGGGGGSRTTEIKQDLPAYLEGTEYTKGTVKQILLEVTETFLPLFILQILSDRTMGSRHNFKFSYERD